MLDDDSIESDLQFAISAASVAGKRLLALRESRRWEGKYLGDIADHASDAFLQGIIQGRYPGDGILTEETADNRERLGRARTWIVDPLDGTREFSERRDDWGVHVALTLDGSCAVAAIGLPANNQILWGVCLDGHQRAGVEGPGALHRGDDVPRLDDAIRVVVSRSHRPQWVDRFAETIGARELEGFGSAGYKTARVLLGQADIYVHKEGLKEWDTCAPETVARALGWHVCKLQGDFHRYNAPNPANNEFLLCRPALRDRVLRSLESCGALHD